MEELAVSNKGFTLRRGCKSGFVCIAFSYSIFLHSFCKCAALLLSIISVSDRIGVCGGSFYGSFY